MGSLQASGSTTSLGLHSPASSRRSKSPVHGSATAGAGYVHDPGFERVHENVHFVAGSLSPLFSPGRPATVATGLGAAGSPHGHGSPFDKPPPPLPPSPSVLVSKGAEPRAGKFEQPRAATAESTLAAIKKAKRDATAAAYRDTTSRGSKGGSSRSSTPGLRASSSAAKLRSDVASSRFAEKKGERLAREQQQRAAAAKGGGGMMDEDAELAALVPPMPRIRIKLIGDVDPADIRQMGIGNCWMLSAISGCATPAR